MSKRKKPPPKFPELDALADAFVAKGATPVAAAQSTRDCAETIAFTQQLFTRQTREQAFRSALDACQELAALIMGDVVKMDLIDGYPTIDVEQYIEYHCKVRH